MQFVTGAEEEPVLGFVLHHSLQFVEVTSTFIPTANTCINCLNLPHPSFTEKADAVPRERICAVGMCFHKPVRELTPGNSYRLCQNPQNPRDFSCVEIKDDSRARATLNRDVAQLLSLYLDTNTVEEPTW